MLLTSLADSRLILRTFVQKSSNYIFYIDYLPMYIPPIYKNNNLAEVRAFLEQHSFAILVSQLAGKPWATHLPLELATNAAGNEVLVGHISRANPQAANFTDGSLLLAIFSGAHSYISSSWYDHENVPTWNYIAVHVVGTVRVLDTDELVNTLKNLVDKYEKGSKSPVSVDSMSEKMFNRELRGIIGFELEIQEIQAAYKLSQNRDEHNHANIIAELDETGDENARKLAEAMRKAGCKH
jgi:transcriptional regulator